MSRYYLTYELDATLHPDGISNDDVRAYCAENPNRGACDAFVFVSVLDEGDDLNVKVGHTDGRRAAGIAPENLLPIWLAMGDAIRSDYGDPTGLIGRCLELARAETGIAMTPGTAVHVEKVKTDAAEMTFEDGAGESLTFPLRQPPLFTRYADASGRAEIEFEPAGDHAPGAVWNWGRRAFGTRYETIGTTGGDIHACKLTIRHLSLTTGEPVEDVCEVFTIDAIAEGAPDTFHGTCHTPLMRELGDKAAP